MKAGTTWSGALALGLLCAGAGVSSAQTAIQKQEGDDEGYISAVPLTSVDTSGTTAGPGSPTGKGRPPRVGPNRQVNDVQAGFPHGLFGRSETSVATTTDGKFRVFGWNDAQGFCGPPFGSACTPPALPGLSGFGYTSDGGSTYVDGGAPPVIDHVFTRGDPWLDRGGFDNSTFYYANLAVDDTTGDSLGVSVHRGHFDAGGVLNWEDVQVFNAPNAPDDFYDKEAIATAQDGSGAGYVSLTNFIKVCGFPQAGGGQIEVWRTHDAGASWQGPAIASPDVTVPNDPNDPNCGATQVLQQSSAPAVGPGGEVYVVWQFGPTFTTGTSANADIDFARSLDGGLTFSTRKSIAAINSMRQDSPVGYNRSRINDHPRIAVVTTGPLRGRIYVVFYSAASPVGTSPTGPCPLGTSPPNGSCLKQSLVSSQVYLTFSDDRGDTWSPPAPVAPGVPATGVKRFWPVVSVEPGGNVDVVYYESQETTLTPSSLCQPNVGGIRRAGSANSLVDTFWVQSIDNAASFSAPTKVTTATTNWCTTVSNIRPNFGDYIGSASGGNRVFPTWADGRNGVPDVFTAPILGAGKSQ